MPSNETFPPNITQVSSETVASLYAAVQQLGIHSQENKSFTLYNFLMFNSFLLVGWATLFSSTVIWLDGIADTLICLIGLLASVAWESLGRNYAEAADLIRTMLSGCENFLPTDWPKTSQARDGQIVDRQRHPWFPFSSNRVGSRHLLIYTPRVLAVGYILFIFLSWFRVCKV